MRVAPVVEDDLAALRALFDVCACTCFCRYWHFGGTKNEWLDRSAHRPEENAHELEEAVRRHDPAARGLVAIDEGGAAVGWMKLVARVHVPKLRRLPVYRSLDLGDEETTFSVGCFLIDPRSRGKGVARALLSGAEDAVRLWGGRAIEGYPRRSTEPLHDEEAWQGPERLFIELGFTLVHDVAPYPVYRKTVDLRDATSSEIAPR